MKIYASTQQLRPCIVNNKFRAIFHTWSQRSEVVAPSIMLGGHNGGQLSFTVAIVEYEDGTIHTAYADEIRFLDSAEQFKQYDFSDKEESK